MGCCFNDCGKNQKKKRSKKNIDLSILNNSSNPYINQIPCSSINNSLKIEKRFIFDVNMGEGTYGFSMKIIEKPSKKEYSLKILPKDNLKNIVNINDIRNFYENNRKILFDSSHINRILNTYENEDNFFLIRNLAPMTLKKKINNSKLPFQIKEVKNIMFQLLKCVKYLHLNNIIHGNIKPENILIFNQNEIKLEDYSHFLNFKINESIINYLFISPEIIQKINNQKCDEWSCGIIMYYLLCGKYPFNGSSIEEISNKILNNHFEESEEYKNLSYQSKDLINKLLINNPKYRITAEDALSHEFFEKNEEFYLFKEDSSINESVKSINDKNITFLIKVYFIFIIVFSPDKNVADLFTNYILGNGYFVDKEKWKLLKFLSDNLISYEEEDIKHIIDYLYNNNIYLLGDNLKTVFFYFCRNRKNDKPKIRIQYIIDALNILIENINFEDLKIPNNMINTDLSFDEFKYIISNNL